MADFDYNNKVDRDLRAYRTHAFTAHLYAGSAQYPSHFRMWEGIAQAWEELADFKKQVAVSNAFNDQIVLTSSKCLADHDQTPAWGWAPHHET